MDMWDKRRRNMKALLAIKGLNGSQAADAAGLSINTVNKFLRGETKTLRWQSLESLCRVLDLSNPTLLDADNPFSDVKNQIYALIEEMSEDEARKELERLKEQS